MEIGVVSTILHNMEDLSTMTPGIVIGKVVAFEMSCKMGQTMISGTIPCTPIEIVLYSLPDTNSVVGTDIFPIVLWAPLTPIR